MDIENWLTYLRDAGEAIYGAFAWPGQYVLMQLSALEPGFVANLDAKGNDTTVIVILSLIYWFLVVVLMKLIGKLFRHIARIIMATIHTITFRITLKAGYYKTRLVCSLKQHQWWRKSRNDTEPPMVEFDRLDLAIMKSAAAKGPGFALSAPELAEQFSLRPAVVQRSLDKLCSNAMINIVIGSTDGYDNYRLTDSGSAFVAMWERQQPQSAAETGSGALAIPH